MRGTLSLLTKVGATDGEELKDPRLGSDELSLKIPVRYQAGVCLVLNTQVWF